MAQNEPQRKKTPPGPSPNSPSLLFEYQCRSGKFIRLANRIESNRNFFARIGMLYWVRCIRVSAAAIACTSLQIEHLSSVSHCNTARLSHSLTAMQNFKDVTDFQRRQRWHAYALISNISDINSRVAPALSSKFHYIDAPDQTLSPTKFVGSARVSDKSADFVWSGPVGSGRCSGIWHLPVLFILGYRTLYFCSIVIVSSLASRLSLHCKKTAFPQSHATIRFASAAVL